MGSGISRNSLARIEIARLLVKGHILVVPDERNRSFTYGVSLVVGDTCQKHSLKRIGSDDQGVVEFVDSMGHFPVPWTRLNGNFQLSVSLTITSFSEGRIESATVASSENIETSILNMGLMLEFLLFDPSGTGVGSFFIKLQEPSEQMKTQEAAKKAAAAASKESQRNNTPRSISPVSYSSMQSPTMPYVRASSPPRMRFACPITPTGEIDYKSFDEQSASPISGASPKSSSTLFSSTPQILEIDSSEIFQLSLQMADRPTDEEKMEVITNFAVGRKLLISGNNLVHLISRLSSSKSRLCVLTSLGPRITTPLDMTNVITRLFSTVPERIEAYERLVQLKPELKHLIREKELRDRSPSLFCPTPLTESIPLLHLGLNSMDDPLWEAQQCAPAVVKVLSTSPH